MAAARAVAAVLDDDESGHSLLRTYGRGVRQRFEGYLASRREFYAMEQRWPTHPFWRSRHGRIRLDPHQVLQAVDTDFATGRTYHLARAEVRRLIQLCGNGAPAHQVLTAYKQARPEGLVSDQRLLETLQYLVETGLVAGASP
jgi:hypothetical protein